MKNSFFAIILLSYAAFSCGEKIDPSSPSIDESVELDSLFDVIYLPSNGFEDINRTIPITNDRPIRVFVDEIGDKDLEYNGNPTPTRIGEPPHYYSDEGGYVFIPNVNNIHWETPGDFAEIPQPFDVYYVYRDLQGLPGESFVNGGSTFNLRNRVTNMSIGLDTTPREFPEGSALPEYNKITIFRIRFDGANSKLWMNNEQVTGTVDVGSRGITEMAMGAINNANQCDFFFAGAKFGTLTQEEHDFIYDKLAEVYPPGVFPDKPLADSVHVTYSNNVFTANYNYVNTLGIDEDTDKTEYIWLHAGNESFPTLMNQQVVPGADGKTMNRLDYPEIFPNPPSGVWLKALVKVWDKEGNTWRYLEGIWKKDNTN
jgi:hypothetical protein